MRIKLNYLLFVLLLSLASADWQGQLSTFGDIRNTNDGYFSQIGLRYVPTWSLIIPWPTAILDTEIALNFYSLYKHQHDDGTSTTFELSPYRLWFRRSTDNVEIRLGLQKITFGSAKIFRPLMWFDKLDPRDPLQLTEGVWGIRIRRDYINNASISTWGLLWNIEPKGWEFIPTKRNNLEFGGRFQMPVWKGEIGLSGNSRIIGRNDVPSSIEIKTMSRSTPEAKAAFDGYFDLGIGIWFESTIVHADFGSDFPNWQSFLTIGSDYTFGIGNGLTITGEYFIYNNDDKPFSPSKDVQITGFMVNYPVSLFDQISGILFYSWDADLAYFYINWQRTYDDWSINLSTFFSTKSDVSLSLGQSFTDFNNNGIQLTLIFNH